MTRRFFASLLGSLALLPKLPTPWQPVLYAKSPELTPRHWYKVVMKNAQGDQIVLHGLRGLVDDGTNQITIHNLSRS